MVAVFVLLEAEWAKELDCKVFQFLHKDQAVQWMLNQLVLSKEVTITEAGWWFDNVHYTFAELLIEDFQYSLSPGQFFHIYPLKSMVAQPTGRSGEVASY